MTRLEPQELIYENPLAGPADIAGFTMEGEGAASFPLGRMRLEGTRDPQDGQAANIVFWCDQTFPDHVQWQWDFRPIHEPGLCILFFAAKGADGQDVLDPGLAPRNGPYPQYHSSDINALHVSYFRRKHPGERAFHVANLRKSRGFHMVCQGPDPLPSVPETDGRLYTITLTKSGPHVVFQIDDIEVFHWVDDGQTYGDILTEGRIAFRQMTPMIAEYANLRVHRVKPA